MGKGTSKNVGLGKFWPNLVILEAFLIGRSKSRFSEWFGVSYLSFCFIWFSWAEFLRVQGLLDYQLLGLLGYRVSGSDFKQQHYIFFTYIALFISNYHIKFSRHLNFPGFPKILDWESLLKFRVFE